MLTRLHILARLHVLRGVPEGFGAIPIAVTVLIGLALLLRLISGETRGEYVAVGLVVAAIVAMVIRHEQEWG